MSAGSYLALPRRADSVLAKGSLRRANSGFSLLAGKTTIIPIPEGFFPPPPLTFSIGVMKDAADRALADHYLQYITSEEGQAFFDAAGFIPAISDKGRELVEKLGVKDV
ncbi:MAG: substrate-binding domain-containing protein [Proteobacteria bacterium]|nr:substrate-binding domain-containing protein [Pseudomonadota bacterium]